MGGCFDILHPGHVVFLQKAKKQADFLIVLLENDQRVKELKGVNRPVHTQKQRAQILSALKFVDYVVMLPYLKGEEEYDAVIQKIKPDVIAVTRGTNTRHHQRSARKIGAGLVYVARIANHSSSAILTSRSK